MRVINRTAITVVGAQPYVAWTRSRDLAFAHRRRAGADEIEDLLLRREGRGLITAGHVGRPAQSPDAVRRRPVAETADFAFGLAEPPDSGFGFAAARDFARGALPPSFALVACASRSCTA